MATPIPETIRPFQGYRMAFTSSLGHPEELSTKGGIDVLELFRHAPQSDRGDFLEWLNGERGRAVGDQVTLVIVGGYYDHPCHKEWLQSIEEEQWFDSGDCGEKIRFTTFSKLVVAVGCESSLDDDWRDVIIEKVSMDGLEGVCASDDEKSLD